MIVVTTANETKLDVSTRIIIRVFALVLTAFRVIHVQHAFNVFFIIIIIIFIPNDP